MCFICLNTTQCQSQNQVQDLKMECLSSKENEYLQELYSVFEQKLIDHYGKLKKHELIFNYVNDFSQLSIEEINNLFFKSFQIDTTSVEFHQMFIRNLQLQPKEDILDDDIVEVVVIGHGAIIDEQGKIIEVGDIDAIKEKANRQPSDYYVINPNGSYALCFLQQKSKNYKVNNLFKYFSVDASPEITAQAISTSFKKSEFKDQLLQTHIMFHLFVLPKLHLQNM